MNYSQRLADALDLFATLHRGDEKLSRKDFLARFPDLATELEGYLKLIEQLTVDGPAAASESNVQSRKAIGGYTIVRRVANGGMGTVYEAFDASLQRRVALKVLAHHLMLDPHSIARFHNEARAVAQLDHPHIVPVLDTGTDGDSHYYSMRFIQGYTLAEIFQRLRSDIPTAFSGPSTLVQLSKLGEAKPSEQSTSETISRVALPSPHGQSANDHQPQFSIDYFCLVAKLGEQAADALHYAHQQGIIHRDIKPSNLMLDQRGHLWVTDFGLAKIESNATLTKTGELVGTLRYMSPEQAHAIPGIVDQRSDVYSLGATLYEMATLQAPLTGSSRDEIFVQLLHGKPTSPRRLQKYLPRDLETILLKALAKNSADRYVNAQLLADDLRRFGERRPILARRAGWGLRSLRWSQRNPRLAFGSIAIVLCMLITLAGAAWWGDASYRQALFERELRKQQEQSTVEAQRHVAAQDAASLTIQAAAAWKNCNYETLHEFMEQSKATPEDSSLPRRILRQIDESHATVLANHQGPAYTVSLSPDETLVASGGEDGVRIHRRETGELLRHFPSNGSDVNGVAWSKDGKLLASVSDSGHLFIYSTHDWQLIGTRKVEGVLVSVQFSLPLGLVVACERNSFGTGENDFHIWELADETKHEVLSGITSLTEGLSLSYDGKLAAMACREGMVYVWDLERRELLHRLVFDAVDNDTTDVSAVAFAHHSTTLAACGRDGTIRVFDGLTGQALPFPPATFEFAESIAFSPDDNLLAVGVRRGLTQVFQRRDSGLWIGCADFKHDQGIWSLCISKDHLLYAVGQHGLLEFWDCSLPMDRRSIKLLSLELGSTIPIDESPKIHASNWSAARAYERAVAALRRKFDLAHHPYYDAAKIQMLPCANKLVLNSFHNRAWQFLDPVTGAPVHESKYTGEFANKPIVSDDEQHMLLASRPDEFEIVDTDEMRVVQTGQYPQGDLADGTFSSDQSRVFVALRGRPPEVVAGPTLRAYDTSNLRQVALSPDLPLLTLSIQPVYTSRALQCLIERGYSPIARAVTAELLTGQVTWVGCSEAEDVFVCANSRLVMRVFRPNDWEHPTSIPLVEGSCVFDISPDGSLIAACTTQRLSNTAPGYVRLFDTRTGREVLSLRHYMMGAWDVCFSPDGRQLMLVGTGISNILELAIWGD